MKTYKLKIVDPLDDPIYRYRKTGCNEWDDYYDAVGNIRVHVGGYNYTGQNINLVFPAPLCMHENPPLAYPILGYAPPHRKYAYTGAPFFLFSIDNLDKFQKKLEEKNGTSRAAST